MKELKEEVIRTKVLVRGLGMIEVNESNAQLFRNLKMKELFNDNTTSKGKRKQPDADADGTSGSDTTD